jgi:polysaccharide biosynthesis transport protein
VTVVEREHAPLPLRSLLLRGLPLAIICAAACAVAAGALSARREKVYTASALVLLRLTPDPVANPGTTPVEEGAGVATESLLVTRRGILTHVAREVPGVTVDRLQSSVTASQVEKTNAIQVIATANQAGKAAAIANGVAEGFVTDTQQTTIRRASRAKAALGRQYRQLGSTARKGPQGTALEQQIQNLSVLQATSRSMPRVTQRAQPPADPTSPRPHRDALFGGIFGFVLGIGLGALWVASDRRVRDPEEVSEVLGVPALASVPRRGRLLGGRRRAREAREQAWRLLQLRLRYGRDGKPVRTVSVTTLGGSGARSQVAWGLSTTAAAAGQRALLIALEPDTKAFNGSLGNGSGNRLEALLAGSATLSEAASRVELPSNGSGRLDLLASHSGNGKLTALVTSRLSDTIRDAASRYELVVIDTPSVLEGVEGLGVVSDVDGTVVVLPERPDRERLLALRSRLEALRARVIGVVVSSA